jgi:hypothetical protein
MGNIKNFNFNKLDLRLSNSDYWDFFLANDEGAGPDCSGLLSGSCFVVWYDFNNLAIFPSSAVTASSIYSLVTWTGATNSGYTANTIGLTGIDNGLVTFDKQSGDTSNLALLSALTGTTLVIPSGDTRLTMHAVTGTTGNYEYPMTYIYDPVVGNYTDFCGGFYQGFYKLDGYTYEVLPTRVPNAWSAEFWLKPSTSACTGTTATTLNDTYPDNAGFFFYMGTRAENKFWNQFYGADSGCTSGCTQPSGCTDVVSEFCTVPKEIDVSIIGDNGIAIPLDPPQVQIDIITNPFLIYGRAYDCSPPKLTGSTGTFIFASADTTTTTCNTCGCCHGGCGCSETGLGTKIAPCYDGSGITVVRTAEQLVNFTNPFLIYGRAASGSGCTCTACSGPGDGFGNQTVCSFTGRTAPITELDYNLDIIDNALGLRIKDDGSIGYRLLTVTGACYTASTGQKLYHSGVTVQESYSISGMVSADTWSYIAVRFVMPYMEPCDLKIKGPRKGKIMFYVNGRLKYVANDIPETVGRRLNEYYLKQVGVPFNFSLGGGSQGLLESQTFDGLDMADRGLPIEKNFAGTFIGSISQFKFNICDLNYCTIQHNYLMDIERYGIQDTNLILSEDGTFLFRKMDME